MKIRMELNKVTKRTHRYAEVSNDIDLESVTPTVYIKTVALQKEFGKIPEHITIEVSNG